MRQAKRGRHTMPRTTTAAGAETRAWRLLWMLLDTVRKQAQYPGRRRSPWLSQPISLPPIACGSHTLTSSATAYVSCCTHRSATSCSSSRVNTCFVLGNTQTHTHDSKQDSKTTNVLCSVAHAFQFEGTPGMFCNLVHLLPPPPFPSPVAPLFALAVITHTRIPFLLGCVGC